MKKHFLKCMIIIAGVGAFSSCANLKQVNDFAATSVKGAAGFESLPYNFMQVCLDNCTEKDIKDNHLNPGECDCTGPSKADSVDYLLYKTISAYLDGLQCLSNNDLTTYQFNGLTDQLSGSGLESLHISAEQSGAYGKLGNILSKAITDGYRRNKIKIYISEANAPLKILIRYLEFNLSDNLIGQLKIRGLRLKSDYFDLLKDQGSNAYDKRKIIEDYNFQKGELDRKAAELLCYAKLLRSIADGHQKLADHLKRLHKADVKLMITQYASSIKDIHTQINLLKK